MTPDRHVKVVVVLLAGSVILEVNGNSRWSVGGLLVLVGAVLIPYSDLVLFRSWLEGGDPDVVSRQLYASNWILYFGGQCLMSLFPALVIGSAGASAATGNHLARSHSDT